jgi:PAB-dependent poly(A)-specific ribonuclease subunit 3
MDVLTFESSQLNLAGAIQHYQQEDMVELGRVVVALACDSLQAASRERLGSSLQYILQHYSQDLKNLVTYLLSPQQPGRLKTINDVMPMIGARFYAQLEASQMRVDLLETELLKEVQNGRLFRLLCKMGTVNERPEYNLDPSWSETGDRYLLKLFRDYLFHQVTDDGRPWLDLSHVIQSMNKLDVGVREKIALTSRDEQNALVVSYADMRRCLDQAFHDLSGPSSHS